MSGWAAVTGATRELHSEGKLRALPQLRTRPVDTV